jgi:hypothetical protein
MLKLCLPKLFYEPDVARCGNPPPSSLIQGKLWLTAAINQRLQCLMHERGENLSQESVDRVSGAARRFFNDSFEVKLASCLRNVLKASSSVPVLAPGTTVPLRGPALYWHLLSTHISIASATSAALSRLLITTESKVYAVFLMMAVSKFCGPEVKISIQREVLYRTSFIRFPQGLVWDDTSVLGRNFGLQSLAVEVYEWVRIFLFGFLYSYLFY